jgi:hypothetical protein
VSELAGVERVYATRSDFLSDMPPDTLFGGASSVVSAGLSNNLLCQHYADRRLERLIIAGAVVTCLFLDPTGTSMAAREMEEGHDPGHLSSLTTLNITHLQRLRFRLNEPFRDRLRLATYDQTIRFNIIVVKRPEAATAVVHRRGGGRSGGQGPPPCPWVRSAHTQGRPGLCLAAQWLPRNQQWNHR